MAAALGLRRKTAAHLADLAARREYLAVRYAPDLSKNRSHPTRMTATLDEIVSKVARRIDPPGFEPARTRPLSPAHRSAD